MWGHGRFVSPAGARKANVANAHAEWPDPSRHCGRSEASQEASSKTFGWLRGARNDGKELSGTIPQWLSRGTPNVLWIFWYLTAGLSTMPSESSPTIWRWISCHGVWLLGYL